VIESPLAGCPRHPIIEQMPRFRALAAVFACLAVLAGGLNVALAAPFGTITAERSMASEPCAHCDDCDKAPCPIPMADCLQTHANAGPALLGASVELLASPYVTVHWFTPHTALSGLSRPPDPFPPRA
jgi:hypothetical protein